MERSPRKVHQDNVYIHYRPTVLQAKSAVWQTRLGIITEG